MADISNRLNQFLAIGGGGSTCVGLSIGTSSIKLVELKKSGKTWKLLHFGIVQLPEDVVINREIINPIVVVESIKTLVGQLKLKNKEVCTSLSELADHQADDSGSSQSEGASGLGVLGSRTISAL